ncbi:MAG: winged helix-turn-helix transcriptional regulator, partial [Chloroflexi bacterium]|nr:winged helix-turn-helix transcriptional regulator [Chloroflexota bacterium]
MKNHKQGLELIKVLAHPVRIQILWALGAGEQYVCHLMTSLGRRQAYVSQQLAFLRQNNLIVATREGQRISYRLRDEELGTLLSKLYALIAPDCYACLVIPMPWWLCPCPKCTEIREQANLPAEPFGSRGLVMRAEISECTCSVCVRAHRISAEDVAVSMNSDCSHLKRWATALHVVHAPLYRQEAQAYRKLYESGADYVCQSNCRAPA